VAQVSGQNDFQGMHDYRPDTAAAIAAVQQQQHGTGPAAFYNPQGQQSDFRPDTAAAIAAVAQLGQ